MRSVNFSDDNLAVQWQYVKRNLGELGVLYQFDDFESQAHGIIQKLIQSCVNEEFALQVRAERYEHAPHRLDERQGTYERNFTTTFGTSQIQIPRLRHHNVKIHYSLFEKYQRRQRKLDKAVVLAMLLGLSVRKQRRFFRSFIGDAISHTTASKLIRTLEGDLQCFRDSFHDTLHYFEFMDDKDLISSTNHLERDLEEVRRRIKIQGYFKSDRSANLWVYGIISQVMQEQQPEVMPRRVTIFRGLKYESVQLS